MSQNEINQSAASAGGDIVGRDKLSIYNEAKPSPSGVEALLIKLNTQIKENQEAQDLIEELARYHVRKSIDGIDGLEAKLQAANLSHTYIDAIDKKERFVKLLERMSLYSSAQKIFVLFLAQAENEFNNVVYPEISNRSESEVNLMIIERIIKPICAQADGDILLIDYNIVFGMIYWLAEQCFIRWHK